MIMVTSEGYLEITGTELGSEFAILDNDNSLLVSWDCTLDEELDVTGGLLQKQHYAMTDVLFDILKPDTEELWLMSHAEPARVPAI